MLIASTRPYFRPAAAHANFSLTTRSNRESRVGLAVDLKPLREAAIAVPTQKISAKRKAEEADASKDLKKILFQNGGLLSTLGTIPMRLNRESSLADWCQEALESRLGLCLDPI
ncbi:hypothetical protein WN48_04680 [Eufriesea mexicana]|uniref:Uncharacterized protein n=1 Tax=Eufriesea mexicana TaxID=516756 RepID=A0A310SKV1_9HYME|nr:hypothetical protein WN48_04680 [Eufriesea mexicana]